jgi:hypothetical protein
VTHDRPVWESAWVGQGTRRAARLQHCRQCHALDAVTVHLPGPGGLRAEAAESGPARAARPSQAESGQAGRVSLRPGPTESLAGPARPSQARPAWPGRVRPIQAESGPARPSQARLAESGPARRSQARPCRVRSAMLAPTPLSAPAPRWYTSFFDPSTKATKAGRQPASGIHIHTQAQTRPPWTRMLCS